MYKQRIHWHAHGRSGLYPLDMSDHFWSRTRLGWLLWGYGVLASIRVLILIVHEVCPSSPMNQAHERDVLLLFSVFAVQVKPHRRPTLGSPISASEVRRCAASVSTATLPTPVRCPWFVRASVLAVAVLVTVVAEAVKSDLEVTSSSH